MHADGLLVQNQPMTYQEVGNQLISAIGFIEQEKKELTDLEQLQQAGQELLDIPQLSDTEKLKLACEILEAYAQTQPSQSTVPAVVHQALRATVKELEMFCGQGVDPKNHLFSKINCTTTFLGQATLAKKLVEPIDDITTLRNRQAFIKELVNNEQLYLHFESLLKQLAHKESDLLSFWQIANPLGERSLDSLYLPHGKSLNLNQSVLTILRWNFRVGTSLAAVVAAGIAIFKVDAFRVALGKQISRYIRQRSLPVYERKPIKIGKEVLSAFLWVAGCAVIGSIAYLSIEQEYTNLRYMHKKLSSVATLLRAAREIQGVVSTNEQVAHGLFLQQSCIEQFEQQEQKLKKLHDLVDLLGQKTFVRDYSFFSNPGRILVAFRLIRDLKNDFVGLMRMMGEVDACFSVAKLYKSMQYNTNATYCFVEYIEQENPCLCLDDFWNPIIDQNIVVTNNIEFGRPQGARTIIVTGSNTGGKSTILKALVANVLLSRLGIAPARKAVMTPFTYVATSMNISDDTAAGISLFKAEVLRAKSIVESINSLHTGQHAFLAIDELFVGTASEKGEEAALKFTAALSVIPHLIFVFATHFKRTAELEKITCGLCKNYKVEAFKDEYGIIVRPFKLEPGMSSNNIAQDILQENISSIDFLLPRS